jgi:hypothetical protein
MVGVVGVQDGGARGFEIVGDGLVKGFADLSEGGVEHLGVGLVGDPSKASGADLSRGEGVEGGGNVRGRGSWAGNKSTDAELVGPSREAVALTVVCMEG